jgi:hypothetical protein
VATHVEEFISLDQNIEHVVATRGARLHRMEMDSRWNILYLIGILHPVPRELQEIRARPYMESHLENKCKLFAWILIHNRILTADNLQLKN